LGGDWANGIPRNLFTTLEDPAIVVSAPITLPASIVTVGAAPTKAVAVAMEKKVFCPTISNDGS